MSLRIQVEVKAGATAKDIAKILRAQADAIDSGKSSKTKSKDADEEELEIDEEEEEEAELDMTDTDEEEASEEEEEEAEEEEDDKNKQADPAIVKAFAKYAKKYDRAKAGSILKKFKVKSVHALKKSDYKKVLALLAK